jgi:hypothetical protein
MIDILAILHSGDSVNSIAAWHHLAPIHFCRRPAPLTSAGFIELVENSTPTRFRHGFDQRSGQESSKLASELSFWCGFALHDFLEQIQKLVEFG